MNKPFLVKLSGLTEALNHHENKRQKIMEYMQMAPCICYIKDSETGKYQYINKSFCDIIGLSEEFIIGKTDLDLFPIEVAQRSVSEDLKVLKNKENLIIITKLAAKMHMVVKFLIINGGISIGGFGIALPDTFILHDCTEEGPNAA